MTATADTVATRETIADELPAILATLPWELRRPKPRKLDLVPIDEPVRLCWRPGEREEWLRAGTEHCWPADWPRLHERVKEDGIDSLNEWKEIPTYLLSGPIEETRPGFVAWDGPEKYREYLPDDALRAIVARYELDAVPWLDHGNAHTPWLGDPFDGPALVPDAVWRLGSAVRAPDAWAWLRRYPESSALGLVPVAAGSPGVRRCWAGEALRRLAADGHRDTVLAAAHRYGPEAADLIATVLAHPERPAVQRKPLPDWLDRTALPPVLLRDRHAMLPATAAEVLLSWLVTARRGWPQLDLAEVAEACDPVSLAGFVTAILDSWLAHDSRKDTWVLVVAGLFGDDSVAERLGTALPGWMDGNSLPILTDALATIGTEPALCALTRAALRGDSQSSRIRAGRLLDHPARERGLTTDALIDTLAPDHGLPADRTVTVDYGSRRFEVWFDHLLQPVVIGPDGRQRKTVPRPAAMDDECATRAYDEFRTLRRNITTLAATRIRRLAKAMLFGRRWTGRAFRQGLLEHTVLRTVTDRLLWMVNGKPFRIAEDGSATDLADGELTLPDDATIGLAHPAELGDALRRWQQVFDDYQIHQPFDQLDRPVYRLAPGETLTARLASYVDRPILSPAEESSSWATIVTQYRGGRQLQLKRKGTGTIQSVALSDPSVLCGPAPDDPVVVSEVILDLEGLVRP